jgi:RimJ/RimL family protein N-acetyltransferase
MAAWIAGAAAKDDPLCFAVVDKVTGRAEGRQSLMRIVPKDGVIEVGGVFWGPRLAKTRMATEALYLHARYAFETLGNRRFEWKTNNRNEASKRAAQRFGFTPEGVFRQHMIIKGENRDTAWFSMLDSEWPGRKAGFEAWLDPANFDAAGRQKTKLAFG